MDLTTVKYKTYNRPGNIPLCINAKLNHPPSIIKSLPENISHRINKLSSDKSIFEHSKDIYNSALSRSIKGISVRITRGKEKLYGSILHIAAMFPPILVNVFWQF